MSEFPPGRRHGSDAAGVDRASAL